MPSNLEVTHHRLTLLSVMSLSLFGFLGGSGLFWAGMGWALFFEPAANVTQFLQQFLMKTQGLFVANELFKKISVFLQLVMHAFFKHGMAFINKTAHTLGMASFSTAAHSNPTYEPALKLASLLWLQQSVCVMSLWSLWWLGFLMARWDGAMHWRIRRFCVGREDASFYGRCERYARYTLYLGQWVMLLLPVLFFVWGIPLSLSWCVWGLFYLGFLYWVFQWRVYQQKFSKGGLL